MEPFIKKNWTIYQYHAGKIVRQSDEVVGEYPLTVIVNDEEFVTLVCSPNNLKELVIGFLASEGVIRFQNEIKRFTIDESTGFAYVDLFNPNGFQTSDFTKRVIGSCCGKGRHFYFLQDVKTAKTAVGSIQVSAKKCLYLIKRLQNASQLFQHTGGVHNAGLCDTEELLLMRTDIGRHNALDKIYGHCLLNQISVRDKLLVFSGRISSEVLLKAAKLGVSIVISKSAPTELALEMANELNITTVGFARGESFNIYTHHHRITE
ncbi:formate dehydrogenase accessory sulfurtransferase FdhD [Bacillus sp. NPDC077027]|uniref:formate dehydrogenase accessory sulfurtransferase FdhD n=1 Tax=Bacillus sp. NPDC077027 TaxID=3390548 RepID=UPI003D046C5D